MTRKIIYTCDACNKEIDAKYGPISLSITMADYAGIQCSGEVCCTKCAIKWTTDTLFKMSES